VFLYYPQSLIEFVERMGISGVGFGGVDPRAAVHPELRSA
jgi:hypothetical protein